jgi:hypothetical protein
METTMPVAALPAKRENRIPRAGPGGSGSLGHLYAPLARLFRLGDTMEVHAHSTRGTDL